MFYYFLKTRQTVNDSSWLDDPGGRFRPELSQHCNVVLRFDLRIWKVTNDKIKTKYERLFSRDTR